MKLKRISDCKNIMKNEIEKKEAGPVQLLTYLPLKDSEDLIIPF